MNFECWLNLIDQSLFEQGYKLWLKSKKIPEEKLNPGIGLTNDQMFFVAFANVSLFIYLRHFKMLNSNWNKWVFLTTHSCENFLYHNNAWTLLNKPKQKLILMKIDYDCSFFWSHNHTKGKANQKNISLFKILKSSQKTLNKIEKHFLVHRVYSILTFLCKPISPSCNDILVHVSTEEFLNHSPLLQCV